MGISDSLDHKVSALLSSADRVESGSARVWAPNMAHTERAICHQFIYDHDVKMRDERKKALSRNAVALLLAVVILVAVIYRDVAKTNVSNLYIVLPAIFIITESVRQIMSKK